MLANLRYFGFLINPISCYYCYGAAGELRAVVAEVTNTPWRERQVYVVPAGDAGAWTRAEFHKAMHVSPFMPMDMHYHWHSSVPGEKLAPYLGNSVAGKTATRLPAKPGVRQCRRYGSVAHRCPAFSAAKPAWWV